LFWPKFTKDSKKHVLATSGDTGGAVASGFLGVAGVEVIILYPSGKVSIFKKTIDYFRAEY
jgi:threonine synthase